MSIPKRNPLLLVVSAPSGAGKTTLCDRLMSESEGIAFSVSCTTRPQREGEVDGKNYHFLSNDQFDERLSAEEFIEHAVVHGFRYGTLKSSVYEAFKAGLDLLMDVDVQGASQIRRYAENVTHDDPVRSAYADVFIVPPSMDTLKTRLMGRGKDDEGVINKRLAGAKEELKHWRDYQYVIVNDSIDDSTATLKSILSAERSRVRRIRAMDMFFI